MRRLSAALACRVQGSRLYGKPLQLLDVEAGVSILDHMLDLLATVPAVQGAVLGIAAGRANEPFLQLAERRGIGAIVGDERDVLQRLIDCGKAAGATDVFRVTTESPFFYHELIDEAWRRHCAQGNDVTTVDGLPEGCHFEIYRLAALEASHARGDRRHRSEYCSLYIREHLGEFQVEVLDIPEACARLDLRLTVDYPEDLVVCRAVYAHLKAQAPRLPLAAIIAFLDERPDLRALVAAHVVAQRLWPKAAAGPVQPSPAPARLKLERSQALKARAERVIPSCTQTFSKGPTQFPQEAAPVFLTRGEGARVWDVDGNEYLDYPMALGPVILGHGYPAVAGAVARQLRDGTVFSLPHPLEVELAEALCEVIPCAEMVRFGKNGSDATAGAVRVARAYTRKEVIACCGYHGWQDWYIGTTTRHAGVPEAVRGLTEPFTYNDLDSLRRIFARHRGHVAAVIMEPVGIVPPQPGFLEQVKEVAHEEGALLIFDEIVTGFRFALGGAQEYFGVTPDLACFGKAMANGLPLSAVVGRREVMAWFDRVFFSFTFGGEALSLAAGLATLRELQRGTVIPHLWAQGRRLQEGYQRLAQEAGLERHTRCVGYPPRTVVTFSDAQGEESLLLKSLFQQECLKRGVLFSGGHNLCAAHDAAVIDRTLVVYAAALQVLAGALATGTVEQRLEGRPVEPVFRRA